MERRHRPGSWFSPGGLGDRRGPAGDRNPSQSLKDSLLFVEQHGKSLIQFSVVVVYSYNIRGYSSTTSSVGSQLQHTIASSRHRCYATAAPRPLVVAASS